MIMEYTEDKTAILAAAIPTSLPAALPCKVQKAVSGLLVDSEPNGPSVVESDVTRQVARMWWADRMTSSVAGCN